MNRQAILEEIAAIVAVDSLKGTETLDSLDEWDSVAVMSFITMVADKLGKTVSGQSVADCNTVNDLVNLALS